MKKDIHPTYYPEARMVCACGKEWAIGSTEKEIHVEICSACHPFFTGKKRIVDTAGKVERFKARAAKTKVMQASRSEVKKKRKRALSQKTKT